MVSVDQIKKLRELTGAGIADCREALEASKGNIEKAQEIIKEKGLARAAKKGERETHNGVVFSYVHGGRIGVLVSLLCETDFVARTDDFQTLGKEICLQVASMKPETVEDLLKQESIRDPKLTIDDMIKEVIGKLGENIKVGEFSRITI
ncbi:translation elongation factor Ts [Patescibacteria group bacterium]|nr:translation elongation factor Ts [Patescibacteria group bacterium]